MANRGRYVYNDPVIDDYRNKKLDKNFINQLVYLSKCFMYQADELHDIIKVRSNPDMHKDRYYQKRDEFHGDSNYYVEKYKVLESINSGDKLTLDKLNKIVELSWGIYNHLTNLYGENGYDVRDFPKFNANEKLTLARFNQFLDNYKKVNNFLNNNWRKYFDGSGYCIMSCQVACQAACQLACQSCQYNTCHNQNCGGWS